jgi:hypothetical protein
MVKQIQKYKALEIKEKPKDIPIKITKFFEMIGTTIFDVLNENL